MADRTFIAAEIPNDLTNVAAPGTPGAGKSAAWTDSTDKNLKVKDDAGVVTETVPVPLPITKGGSGQITKAPAFDALAPTATRGDLIVRGASANVLLAKGTPGQILGCDADDAKWIDPPSAPQLILSTKTHLTTADIFALNTTPIDIVTTPGPGKVIIPITITIHLIPGPTAFAAPSPLAGELVAVIDATTWSLYAGINLDIDNILLGNDWLFMIWPNQSTSNTPAFQPASLWAATANISDKPMQLMIDGASGPMTIGDGTLDVFSIYYIQTL